MRKYIVLILLALVTLTGAVLEGLVELSPQFIQINGLMTILCAGALITWTLIIQADEVLKH